jgi:hypothetical protein
MFLNNKPDVLFVVIRLVIKHVIILTVCGWVGYFAYRHFQQYSVILWGSVLLEGETRKNYRPATSH